MTVSGFLVMLGIPLLFSRWCIGLTLILLGFINALSQVTKDISEQEKHEIRFQTMTAAEIGEELKAMDNVMSGNEHRSLCLAALLVLAKKYNIQKQSSRYHPHELECICQEAAYIVLRLYPQDDDAVAAALSLNALVASDSQVRERLVHKADIFGVNVIIDAMRSSLKRAQDSLEPGEEEEQLSAELQRKACLLLGALVDNDLALATKIVDEHGLEAILDAVKWYRYHEEVANWGLWAIFVLCYDHPGNKTELLRIGGIHVICQTIKNNRHSLEVSRHGIAILFDTLREAPQTPAHVAQIRKIALNAGLHEVILSAMNEFDISAEINMMGREILIGTGYGGEIPGFQPFS